MRAGQRETPIQILVATTTHDERYNNDETTWGPGKKLWASREDRLGKEFFEDGALITQTTARFTVDWLDGHDITEEMRLLCDGREWNIKSVDHDSDLKRFVKIEAVAGLNETQR